jgi:hypothetical protein
VLVAVLAGAVLLRARVMPGHRQRVPLAVAGTAGLTLLAWSFAGSPTSTTAVAGVLLAAAGLLLAAAIRLPAGRLRPLWGHLGDLAETWTALALVPLVLQVAHGYALFRSLAG